MCARSSGLCLLDTAAQGCLLYLHNPTGRLLHVTTEPEAHLNAAAASFDVLQYLRQQTSHPGLAGYVQH